MKNLYSQEERMEKAMDDYINRQAALDVLHGYFDGMLETDTVCPKDLYGSFEVIPSADVQPVRHGHWQITDAYPHNVYCSECHKRFAQTHWAVWEDGSLPRNFCPTCGVRMDGEQNGT